MSALVAPQMVASAMSKRSIRGTHTILMFMADFPELFLVPSKPVVTHRHPSGYADVTSLVRFA